MPLDIYNILTPVALAIWIAGDGSSHPSGLILCTHSFTIQDVVRLMNVLLIKYDIESTLRFERGLPTIYIKASSMARLRTLVLPYLHPSIHYKLFNKKAHITKA